MHCKIIFLFKDPVYRLLQRMVDNFFCVDFETKLWEFPDIRYPESLDFLN